MVNAMSGMLVQGDEPTIEFIKHLDETNPQARFIVQCINPTSVFVQEWAMKLIREGIRARDNKNTYTDIRGVTDGETQ